MKALNRFMRNSNSLCENVKHFIDAAVRNFLCDLPIALEAIHTVGGMHVCLSHTIP